MEVQLTLTQLRHMAELAKTGSFIKSSENLFVTQPALSRSIKSLEDELGAKLFDRQGRQTTLTAFGEEILSRSQILLDLAKDIKETHRNFKNGLSGQIRIGMGSGAGALLMTPLLEHIVVHYPHLRIEVARGKTGMLIESLRARKLDALIINARSMLPALDLKMEVIYETPGAFMVRKGHPLRKLKKISIDDLRKYPIASTALSEDTEKTIIDRYGKDANLDNLVNIKCSEISSLVEVAQQSNTVLLAIRNSALELEELVLTPPLNATARFGFVTIENRTESPLLRHVRDFVEKDLSARPNQMAIKKE
ncbi:LysR family transcriptional regulator [Polynucleobacter sp. AP-Nickl1-40-C4]|uniref:LysR substrate-binding domain-containing protein n=1 Tax=Polynucleobacter sp. AP-Nickl1-40-C4 TaxID=3108275 RepID=UPI002B237422|nr:LysR family transcriptional regulator [Polynucleobacter sp. AP-Nickl1-40-C4]MEA9569067.1 LysR family transcriptional regulator [Polynucleobacter sp. AP-Nickl1-40-C4]